MINFNKDKERDNTIKKKKKGILPATFRSVLVGTFPLINTRKICSIEDRATIRSLQIVLSVPRLSFFYFFFVRLFSTLRREFAVNRDRGSISTACANWIIVQKKKKKKKAIVALYTCFDCETRKRFVWAKRIIMYRSRSTHFRLNSTNVTRFFKKGSKERSNVCEIRTKLSRKFNVEIFFFFCNESWRINGVNNFDRRWIFVIFLLIFTNVKKIFFFLFQTSCIGADLFSCHSGM